MFRTFLAIGALGNRSRQNRFNVVSLCWDSVFTDDGTFYDVAHFVYVQSGKTYVNLSRKGQFNNIC